MCNETGHETQLINNVIPPRTVYFERLLILSRRTNRMLQKGTLVQRVLFFYYYVFIAKITIILHSMIHKWIIMCTAYFNVPK